MDIGTALNSGVQGLQQASQGISESSANIARARTDREQVDREQVEQQSLQSPAPPPTQNNSVNVSEELVNLRVEQFNAQANTQSIQTADEVLGTLIDVRV